MDKNDIEKIENIVNEKLKTISVKKVGDTPLEFYDLVNKGFIDGYGRSHKTSDQTVNDQATDKIVWQVNDFSSGIKWDSTNNRFTIKTSGKYLVTASAMFTTVSATGLYELLIYKNGVEYSRSACNSSAATNVVTPMIIDIVSLIPNDYIEIFAFHNSGASKTIGGASIQSYFNIKKIG